MARWPDGSPLTVAGAARAFHPTSLFIPLRGTCRTSADKAAFVQSQGWKNKAGPARSNGATCPRPGNGKASLYLRELLLSGDRERAMAILTRWMDWFCRLFACTAENDMRVNDLIAHLRSDITER
jgi:hypothetical protein